MSCCNQCSGRPVVYRRRTSPPTVSNDQGIGWVDSEGPFSLHGASEDGWLEGCGPECSFTMNKRNDNEPYSFHREGANFLFADGHVRFLNESISLTLLAALVTMSAGEVENFPN